MVRPDSNLDSRGRDGEPDVGRPSVGKPRSNDKLVVTISRTTANRLFLLLVALGAAGGGYFVGKDSADQDLVACRGDLNGALSREGNLKARVESTARVAAARYIIGPNGQPVPVRSAEPADAVAAEAAARQGGTASTIDPSKADTSLPDPNVAPVFNSQPAPAKRQPFGGEYEEATDF
ncbi:MAG: hypothetical protein Q8P62_01755 [Candidatus Peregrinibacteria bacterium]|nr:hypothetical protein [Candidatus Peregrinibacteria bacterium]